MKLNYILTSVDKFVLKRTIFKDALQSAHDCMDLLDFIAHFKIKLPDSNLASIVTDFEDFYLNGEYNDKDEDCDNLNLIISLSSFLKLNYLDIDQKIFKGICIALIKRLDTLIINEYPCDDFFETLLYNGNNYQEVKKFILNNKVNELFKNVDIIKNREGHLLVVKELLDTSHKDY